MNNGKPARFVLVVEAIPDGDGNPTEIRRILGTHLLEGSAAGSLIPPTPGAKKMDDKAETALSFCQGLKELAQGIQKIAIGSGIIIITVGQAGAPYVVDMANRIATPLFKKLGLK